MKHLHVTLTAALLLTACTFTPEDGLHTLHVLTTNDVHGSYFNSTYVGGGVVPSLFSVKAAVDSIRNEVGEDNVLLIDAGDMLQGDNAAYYFNYVDTVSTHVYPRLAHAIGYDAVTVGNHDVETGHHVYDRIRKELESYGIPFLGGNAVKPDGSRYFQLYKTYRRAGMKVLVLGYSNANIAAWLDGSIWSGMTFESLVPLVQQDVDRIVAKEKPQVVIVAVHSGTGKGNGDELESQGLDLLHSLRGVDLVVAAHDHRPYFELREDGRCALVNAGCHCRYMGEAVISVSYKYGVEEARSVEPVVFPLERNRIDNVLRDEFWPEYEAVKAFTLREVGTLSEDMYTRDSYVGMCGYMNLLHTICLKASGADVSMAAPLSYDKKISAGTLVYNDMFSIYPYENQLFTLRMTGKEIVSYLELSYDGWINTVKTASDHALKIQDRPDPRTGAASWSFIGRPYNFDSAAGISYTVDLTKPFGSRVTVTAMADGSAFDTDAEYVVCMTSYRASGGGGLIREGAGIQDPDARIVGKYSDIRDLVYGFISARGSLDIASLGDPALLGTWSFVPEKLAKTALERDFNLIFD